MGARGSWLASLRRELLLEGRLQFVDRRAETLWVHEPVGIVGIARPAFPVHPELAGMRSEKHIQHHRLLSGKGARVSIPDVRKPWHPAYPDPGVDAAHVDDADPVVLLPVAHREGEARRALRVTGVEVNC